MTYWSERIIDSQEKLTNQSIIKIQKQLRKYYKNCWKSVEADFEALFEAAQAKIAAGQTVTMNDIYKMDRYCQIQAKLKEQLKALGDKEIAAMDNNFEKQWKAIYGAALPKDMMFNEISVAAAKSAINTTWCADGKHFSSRVWKKNEQLVNTLNEELVNCVVTGKKTSELKQNLMERFNVSYSQADRIVRTESAHIQTQASQQRYKDAGITHYKFLGRHEHNANCDCGMLNGKIFSFDEAVVGVNMPPMHPNCRCAIAPVVEEAAENTVNKQSTKMSKVKRGQTEDNPYTSAALAKQKKEALANGEELTYYGHTCESCGLYFETKKPYAKTCPVCKNQIHSYRGGQEKHITKCIKCGKGFITMLGQNINVCPDCQTEMLATKEAKRILKRGYTEKGTIKVMTGQTKHLSYINPKYDKNKNNDTLFNANYNSSLLDLFIEQNADIDKHAFDEYSDKDKNNKFFVCIDCGKVVFKGDNRNNRADRCPECYAAYRKKYKAEKERERRKKKKK